jgi:hypothetical protein
MLLEYLPVVTRIVGYVSHIGGFFHMTSLVFGTIFAFPSAKYLPPWHATGILEFKCLSFN